jgi:hypothetical protein
MVLAWECSWFDLAILTYGEAMKPTFGTGDDIKMPTDGYCFYHCFNYASSNGASPLTRSFAMRLRNLVVFRMRKAAAAGGDCRLSEEADRLLDEGEAGYPDEDSFPYIAAEVGYSFALVQDGLAAPLVYGSEHGAVRLTIRRHDVTDGAGHSSPHFDIISYDKADTPAYEELGGDRLDPYHDFLQSCLLAERTIGNTALIQKLEAAYGVSCKNSTMAWWRGKVRRAAAATARISLHEACDAYDAMIASMDPSSGPTHLPAPPTVIAIDGKDDAIEASSEPVHGAMEIVVVPIGVMTDNAAINSGPPIVIEEEVVAAIDSALAAGDTEDTMTVPIQLVVGAMDSALAAGVAISGMADSADGTIGDGAIEVEQAPAIEQGVSIAAVVGDLPSGGATALLIRAVLLQSVGLFMAPI